MRELPLVEMNIISETVTEIVKELMIPTNKIGVIINSIYKKNMMEAILFACQDYGLTIDRVSGPRINLLNDSFLYFGNNIETFRGTTLNYCFIFDEFDPEYLNRFAPYNTKVIFRNYIVPDLIQPSQHMDWTTYNQYGDNL